MSYFSYISDQVQSYMKLEALNYRNLNLGVFFEKGEHRNVLAEQIIKCMKEQSYTTDIKEIEEIYGDVYICNENGDMSNYIWRLIKGVVYYKMNKKIPPDFVDKNVTLYRISADNFISQ